MKIRTNRFFISLLAMVMMFLLPEAASGMPPVQAKEKTITVNLDIGEELLYGSYHILS